MKILEVYNEKLSYLNYSKRTIEIYSHYFEKFLIESETKDPYQVSTSNIEKYLVNKKYSSISQQNQIIGSLKLFAKHILGKKDVHLSKISRPRKENKIPKIVNAELIAEKILKIKNLKHKAVLSLGLSCGLRVSEVIELKWAHLNRFENTLTVVNGKGRKDRVVKLNKNLINILTLYWRNHKSKEYVFNGQKKLKYSASSIQKLMKHYIGESTSFHTLRHSFSTFAIDNGTPLPVLQKTLGHSSSKTTELYLHLSNKSLNQLRTVI